MRLVTLQKLEHWKFSCARGILTGGTTLHHVEPSWRPAYEWMREQMKARLPWHSGDFPIWAWLEEDYDAHIEERMAYCEEVGTEMVEIRFSIPKERVLLSDFVSWHCVLMRIAITDEDEFAGDIQSTWPTIFDVHNVDSIQASVDRILPSEVTDLSTFQVKPSI